MSDPIPLQPRRDDTAADMRSLVQLGEAEPQPVPASAPAPTPDPVDEKEAALLSAALMEAGVETAADDQAAARAVASLDPATVAAVQRWIKAPRKTKPTTPASK
ncbi:hypothetical protein [Streptomyces azureus]|uniref:Uncharacterized protein n=1 Tax=Streptomyces azureus TaxID=146537 RepID=A0A0K8PGI8_STRAJ|nr:hypothetical protein [Streptomyces azureus]GAP46853.1 predicted protein [Streptomyces azureus]